MTDEKTLTFDTMFKFRIFEMALENELQFLREARFDTQQIPQAGKSRDRTVIELLDRAQRKRHGHSDGEVIKYEFDASTEIYVGLIAVLRAIQMTDNVGVPEGYDEERVKTVAGGLLADLKRLHPSDDPGDELEVA